MNREEIERAVRNGVSHFTDIDSHERTAEQLISDIMHFMSGASPPAIGEPEDVIATAPQAPTADTIESLKAENERPAPFTCSEVATIVREHTDVIEALSAQLATTKTENERLRDALRGCYKSYKEARSSASAVWEEAARVVSHILMTRSWGVPIEGVIAEIEAALRSRAKPSEVGG